MIEIRGMTPLLYVFDLDRSIQFYSELLGFSLKTRSEGWAWVVRDEVELMLNTAYDTDEQPAVPDAGRVEAHGDTALYFGCPDVDAAYEYLVSRGVAVEKPHVAYYGMKQLHLKDPDGFHVCLQWRA
jgi:catechol 2,3-dioxygenase-like lactoylglutathione lyase family enzyme